MMNKLGFCLLVTLILGVDHTAHGADGFASLENRPVPTSEYQRAAECAWIRSQEAEQKYDSEALAILDDNSKDDSIFQLFIRQNIDYLQSRYSRIHCDVVATAAPGPSQPVQSPVATLLDNAHIALIKGGCDDALKIYRDLANHGNADAQYYLGEMYEEGKGVVANSMTALSWYLKAANQGQADAQNMLGDIYRSGGSVDKNMATAFAWWLKAANQGQAEAQVTLGIEYLAGKTVPADSAAAAMWISKAAEQGNAMAQVTLGGMYQKGTGMPQDYVLSYEWFNLAASSSPAPNSASIDFSNVYRTAAAKARDNVAAKMTVSQIAEAQTLTRERNSRATLQPARSVVIPGVSAVECKIDSPWKLFDPTTSPSQ